MELTDRAWMIVQKARDEADRLGDDYIGSDHILLALLRDGGGAAAYVLEDMGVDYDEVLSRLVSQS
jgi:ATP-dependent Clp protease ATP-binding subunit ClpC